MISFVCALEGEIFTGNSMSGLLFCILMSDIFVCALEGEICAGNSASGLLFYILVSDVLCVCS